MAEAKKKTEHTPREIVRGALGVDYAKAAGARDAREFPRSQGRKNVDVGVPKPTQQEVARQTHMDQHARPEGRPERDDRLTSAGRGRHTTGRLGGVS